MGLSITMICSKQSKENIPTAIPSQDAATMIVLTYLLIISNKAVLQGHGKSISLFSAYIMCVVRYLNLMHGVRQQFDRLQLKQPLFGAAKDH